MDVAGLPITVEHNGIVKAVQLVQESLGAVVTRIENCIKLN